MKESRQVRVFLLHSHLLIPVILLFEYIWLLQWEWRLNEQYSYGVFVPLLFLYLCHLRWSDRPPAGPRPGTWWFWLGLCLSVLLWWVGKVVLIAQPDWRPPLWIACLALGGGGCLYLHLWGGRSWLFHYLPALALLATAIPWPGRLEMPLVQGLMEIVATVAVEVLNLLGLYAERSGNLIRLSTGLVGVEEACSGVRSLQFTLMAAWFLGEMKGLKGWSRGLLLVGGSAFAFLVNLGRTLTLTLLASQSGIESVEKSHDWIGYTVMALTFFGLLGLAAWLEKFTPSQSLPKAFPALPAPPPRIATLSVLFLYLTGFASAYAWYGWHEEVLPPEPIIPRLKVASLPPDIDVQPLSSRIRTILRCSQGWEYEWKDGDGVIWKVFLLHWESGSISSTVNTHRPEVCLPGAGLRKVGPADPLPWPDHPRTGALAVQQFSLRQWPVHTFYAAWTNRQEPATLEASAAERLRQVSRHHRLRQRYSLQIVLIGSSSLDRSRAKVTDFLHRAVELTY